jgi:hypothetical protein
MYMLFFDDRFIARATATARMLTRRGATARGTPARA